jgi:hypothetical protein
MAIRNRTVNSVAYGFTTALQDLSPLPIVASRAPIGADSSPVGALWCWPANAQVWVNDGIINGVSQWLLLTTSGAAGVFSSLLVNPGPVTTQGTGAVSISGDAVGTTIGLGAGAGAKLITIGSVTGASSLSQYVGSGNYILDGVAGSTYTIGASTTTGTITIGGTAQTGAITIGGGTGAQTVNLATGGTGAKTVHIADGAAANVVTVGSTTAASTLTLNTPTGTQVVAANGLVATVGNITATNGNVVLSTAATFVQLPGPIKIMSGAGAPAGGLAAEAGDLYINTTGSTTATRLYIATGAGAWTYIASNA